MVIQILHDYHSCASYCLSVGSLAGYVEVLASRLGMQVPDLTPKQADMWQTRVSSHMVSDLEMITFYGLVYSCTKNLSLVRGNWPYKVEIFRWVGY